MIQHRFFVLRENIRGRIARLSGEDSHHLRNVLRIQIGDRVVLFDGRGTEYPSLVTKMGTRVELEILSQSRSTTESQLHLVLGQSLLKGQKMDWVIQKGTELGMAELIPLRSQFSEVTINHPSKLHKMQRWNRTAQSASAQCGRAVTPIIHPPLDVRILVELLNDNKKKTVDASVRKPYLSIRPDLCLVVNEKGGIPARTLQDFPSPRRVLVLVGPEGGWSKPEIQGFRDAGCHLIDLGPRILRSETAAVTVTGILQYLWGDLAKRDRANI